MCHFQICAAAGSFTGNSLTNARCAILFDYVRAHPNNTQNAFSIDANAIAIPEKINAWNLNRESVFFYTCYLKCQII